MKRMSYLVHPLRNPLPESWFIATLSLAPARRLEYRDRGGKAGSVVWEDDFGNS
jgi:hypothetical protein